LVFHTTPSNVSKVLPVPFAEQIVTI